MANLATIVSQNSTLELLAPGSTKPLGLRVELLPPDHERLKEIGRQFRDKHRLLAQKGRPVTTADEIAISKTICITAAVGWEWYEDADWNGETPAFDRTIWKDMMERDWIRSQVDEHLGDTKNFFTV
jgi:hypothetical protein